MGIVQIHGFRLKYPTRHVLAYLWPMVLSLILAEFFKGAYRVWDRSRLLSSMVTLAACAIFLAKQVADLFLYYRLPDEYDPSVPGGNRWLTLIRLFLENTQELLLLFFIYGAIQEISVHNLSDSMTGDQLKRAVGSGLLICAALVEFTWLFWEILYLGRRMRYIAVMRKVSVPPPRRIDVWRQHGSVNRRVVIWACMNAVMGIVFLLLWKSFRYSQFWSGWDLDPSIPSARSAFCYLLLPITLYFLLFHAVLRDYYLGEVQVSRSSP